MENRRKCLNKLNNYKKYKNIKIKTQFPNLKLSLVRYNYLFEEYNEFEILDFVKNKLNKGSFPQF